MTKVSVIATVQASRPAVLAAKTIASVCKTHCFCSRLDTLAFLVRTFDWGPEWINQSSLQIGSSRHWTCFFRTPLPLVGANVLANKWRGTQTKRVELEEEPGSSPAWGA